MLFTRTSEPIHSILKIENILFFSLNQYNLSFSQICLLIGNVSRLSDVAHEPLGNSVIE